MLRNIRNRTKGFTLIELAIVLTIAGLMFAGLWRLLNGGNQQVRDQGAASQQTQLIGAVKNFLGSAQGQTWLGGIGANAALGLPLPAGNTACLLTGTLAQQFACFLPSGFSTATVNAYGQNYAIWVLKDGTAAPNPPNSYSFMIVTTLGDVIPDTSGGRLSASIGNDGGFIYSNNICNAQTGAGTTASACGSYGAWAANVTTYGVPGAQQVSGHIATRTYSTPSANTFPWLARPLMPGDNASSPVWNSMKTDLFLGASAATAAPNKFWLGSDNNLAGTTGGTINMQGGQLAGSAGSTVNLSNLTTPTNGQVGSINVSAGGIGSPLLNLSNGPCVPTGVAVGGALTGQNPAGCNYSIIADNVEATQTMYANAFYAPNFNYNQASDIRFKKDVEPLKNALADIMKLKPVSYRMKSDDEKSMKSMGVIAQDLEKVYPQLVTSTDMKYVKYMELIAPLIGAVQELKEENDRLREELQAQQRQQERLEKKIGLSEPGGRH